MSAAARPEIDGEGAGVEIDFAALSMAVVAIAAHCGYSQNEVARRTRVYERLVNDLFAGKVTRMSANAFAALLKFTGMPAERFVRDIEPAPAAASAQAA